MCPSWTLTTAEAEEEDEDDLYGAAYDEMTYQDSTDDAEGAFPTAANRRTNSIWNARATGWIDGCTS